MIATEVYARLRAFKANGVSMRKAAVALGLSRNTAKKYWDGAHTPDERINYPATVESASKKVIMDALRTYFEENRESSFGTQRVTAKTAWAALRNTFNVGESTVRRYPGSLSVSGCRLF
jgi:transposase